MWRVNTEWPSVRIGRPARLSISAATGWAALLLLGSVLGLAGCARVAPSVPEVSPWRLEVRTSDHELLTQITLPPDGSWCMAWHHSVAGFLVQDCYGVAAGALRLESSHQPDFAAGLGYTEGRGRLESDGDGGYRIVDINEPVPGNAYWLRVGAMSVNHRIVWDTQEVSLSALAAGERVEIRLKVVD